MRKLVRSILPLTLVLLVGCESQLQREFFTSLNESLEDPSTRTSVATFLIAESGDRNVWVILPVDGSNEVEGMLAFGSKGEVKWEQQPTRAACSEVAQSLRANPLRPRVRFDPAELPVLVTSVSAAQSVVMLTEIERCSSLAVLNQLQQALRQAGWQTDELALVFVREPSLIRQAAPR